MSKIWGRHFWCIFILLGWGNPLRAVDLDRDWLEQIRPEHPRLFINPEILPLVKSNAKGVLADHYKSVKERVAVFLESDDIQFHVYECTLPSLMICYFVEGDECYKAKALWVLKEGSRHLGKQFEKKEAVSWFSFSRIALMMGYDWLYEDLSGAERRVIARAMMENVERLNDVSEPKIVGENYGGFPEGGFYGVNNLKWYAGLTFYGDGIDDAQCVAWMKQGVADMNEVAAFRRKSGGDDGGMSAVVLGYVFGAYPRAEWNFIHTWRSAMGGNIGSEFSYIANITNWLVWRTIQGKEGKLYIYGSGDVHHPKKMS